MMMCAYYTLMARAARRCAGRGRTADLSTLGFGVAQYFSSSSISGPILPFRAYAQVI